MGVAKLTGDCLNKDGMNGNSNRISVLKGNVSNMYAGADSHTDKGWNAGVIQFYSYCIA